MLPDAAKHDPRPEYLWGLLTKAGMTPRDAAFQIGIPFQSMRAHLTDDAATHWPAPYVVQYALERLAGVE